MLCERIHLQVAVRLIFFRIPVIGFLGVQRARLLRCAMCLFWWADLWLQPSRQMSTIQNPKNSRLAMEPACSLVEDTALGQRLPVSGSGCPPNPRLLVSSGRWSGPQPISSPLVFAQSFVLWVGLAVPQVRAVHGIVLCLCLSLSLFFFFFFSLYLAIPQFGLLFQVSSLRLPSRHLGLVLTLRNAAQASLFSPRLLVAAASAGSFH